MQFDALLPLCFLHYKQITKDIV